MKAYQLLKHHIYTEGILHKKKTFKRNEFLKIADTTNTNIYFIVSGSVKVSFIKEEEEYIMYFGYKDSIITALDSFLIQQKSQLEIKALKNTETYFLSKDEFHTFLNSDAKYLKLWNNVLEEIVLYQFERQQNLLLPSPEERFNDALHKNPELFQEIPHKYIAAYLRMSPETLSRLKKS
ncbi:Crp/Fnr family transcriptional regulator [Tenacibaculum agarivorans]|uniref:Crp/Fnr family transcriptional regulator n=1 Tax=Tenacibaculum agarivorans TaxID=1908389 RepID=UPI00094BAAC2|nr:Crp/Fnr family transcriptional regulator [Tenacibaculum agarivorans]